MGVIVDWARSGFGQLGAAGLLALASSLTLIGVLFWMFAFVVRMVGVHSLDDGQAASAPKGSA